MSNLRSKIYINMAKAGAAIVVVGAIGASLSNPKDSPNSDPTIATSYHNNREYGYKKPFIKIDVEDIDGISYVTAHGKYGENQGRIYLHDQTQASDYTKRSLTFPAPETGTNGDIRLTIGDKKGGVFEKKFSLDELVNNSQ